jgi:hypothetical protein
LRRLQSPEDRCTERHRERLHALKHFEMEIVSFITHITAGLARQ